MHPSAKQLLVQDPSLPARSAVVSVVPMVPMVSVMSMVSMVTMPTGRSALVAVVVLYLVRHHVSRDGADRAAQQCAHLAATKLVSEESSRGTANQSRAESALPVDRVSVGINGVAVSVAVDRLLLLLLLLVLVVLARLLAAVLLTAVLLSSVLRLLLVVLLLILRWLLTLRGVRGLRRVAALLLLTVGLLRGIAALAAAGAVVVVVRRHLELDVYVWVGGWMDGWMDGCAGSLGNGGCLYRLFPGIREV